MPRADNSKNLIGKGFDKRPQNINRKGRKPLLIKDLVLKLKDEGYQQLTAEELTDCYTSLLNLDETRLKEIHTDKTAPYFLRLLVQNMNSPRFLEVLDRVIDRSFGKAQQKIQFSEADAPTPAGATKSEEELLAMVDKRVKEIDLAYEANAQNERNQDLLGES